METTITWVIEHLNCDPVEEGGEKIVSSVNWRLIATSGTYVESAYGTHTIPKKDDAAFIQYPDLLQDVVVAWVQDAMGPDKVKFIEEDLIGKLDRKSNSAPVEPPTPWSE